MIRSSSETRSSVQIMISIRDKDGMNKAIPPLSILIIFGYATLRTFDRGLLRSYGGRYCAGTTRWRSRIGARTIGVVTTTHMMTTTIARTITAIIPFLRLGWFTSKNAKTVKIAVLIHKSNH